MFDKIRLFESATPAGSWKGRGSRRTVWTTLKMATLAPRQTASVMRTVAVKVLSRARVRMASSASRSGKSWVCMRSRGRRRDSIRRIALA